jgi:hypothetical protein
MKNFRDFTIKISMLSTNSNNSNNSNIFYSQQERLLVFDSEPLPNRTYKVHTSKSPNYRLKIDNDNSFRITDSNGRDVEKIKNKPRIYERGSTDAIIDWIHQKCPDIDNLDYMFDPKNEDTEELIIKGYVQSGKTSFMLCSALKYMFGTSSMSSIIVLRNAVGDSTQINSRIRDMKTNIKDYLRGKQLNYDIDFTVLGDHVGQSDFETAITGVNPQIFVVLGNGSQIHRLNNLLNKVSKPKYAVFIDEADSNDTGDNRRIDEITKLKDGANRLFYISATILELGLRENKKDISVYMLKDVPHYMGIEKLINRPLADKAESNNRKDDDPVINDPNMRGFISRFETLEPHTVEFMETSHPQHCLISCGTVIQPQQRLFRFISEHDIAVLLYNGNGIDLYHRSLDGEKIRIKSDGGRLMLGDECTWRPGAHSFGQTIGIASVIQWLKDNGGVKRFPRIITISGKLAGRGISFVSDDYGRYLGTFARGSPPKWIGWRLTSMYYIPSKSTSQPNLMQCVGRVCCVVRDNIPTYLYANDDVLMDIRKSYWVQEELVTRTRKYQEVSEMNVGEAMHHIKMKNTKLSRRPLTTTGIKQIRRENQVEWFQEDDGFDINETYEKNLVDDNGWGLKPTSINVTPPETDNDTLIMDVDEWTRLTTRMFLIWSDSSSYISCFMHNLDPNKIYSKSEIMELCQHTNIRLGDVVIDKSGKSNKYGSIIYRSSHQYRLYPELVESYKLHF